MGMSQHEVSFLTPKWLRRKENGHLIFRHAQTRKKHVLQQWQWIVFGSAKPAQDEKTKNKEEKWNQQMQKQQHTVIKSKMWKQLSKT